MMKSFRDWLSEGENIYTSALGEFHALEEQLATLEQQLSSKKDEVNQIAQVIGKPAVDGVRKLSAELVDAAHLATGALPVGNVARALTGRTGAVAATR